MTGDMGEVFNAMREASKERRAKNRERGPELLREAGIPFEVYNGGAHLKVGFQGDIYDYWPGTGYWKSSETRSGHRGVRKLIERIKRKQNVARLDDNQEKR